MDEELKQRLTSKDLWVRAIYMALFAVAYLAAEVLVVLTMVVQFVSILITGSANEQLLKLGLNLSTYVYQIVRFETFNSEEKPFPLSDWPTDEPDGNRWLAEPVDPTATSAPAAAQPEDPTPTVANNQSDGPSADDSAKPDDPQPV